MIELNRLFAFQLVAATGGYAKAARAAPYPITQPALHQQVRKLERELGMALLERIAKDQMRPTPAGAHLLAFVAPFFRDLPAVLRSLQRGEFDGHLSIEAEPLLIRRLLPAWLLALRRQRPTVQLHLRELAQNDVAPLRSGRADVLIGYLPEIPDDIASQQVATLHPCIVVPKELAPAGGKAPRLRDLAGTPFLAYPAGSLAHGLQMRALATFGAAPQQTMNLDHADAILGFVESGLGWSLLPSLEPQGQKGARLASFPLRRPKLTFPVVMAWRKDAPENPMLDALLGCAP